MNCKTLETNIFRVVCMGYAKKNYRKVKNVYCERRLTFLKSEQTSVWIQIGLSDIQQKYIFTLWCGKWEIFPRKTNTNYGIMFCPCTIFCWLLFYSKQNSLFSIYFPEYAIQISVDLNLFCYGIFRTHVRLKIKWI